MGPTIRGRQCALTLRLDPVAGFVIAAFAIYEGKEAWEGELAETDDDDDD